MNDKNTVLQLLEKCKKDDPEAFRKLISIYRSQLFTYLLRTCKDRMTAEDLFQETLINVWKGIKNYKEHQKFSSWLFTIAHNVSIDAIRTKNVRKGVIQLNADIEMASEVNPHSELIATETRLSLEKEVGVLPENQKQVFLLRQHGGLSFKEIAIVMNQPLNTVLSHMHYAVKKLRAILREDYE